MAGFARIPLKLYFIEKLLYKTHGTKLSKYLYWLSFVNNSQKFLFQLSSGEVKGNQTLASIARLAIHYSVLH